MGVVFGFFYVIIKTVLKIKANCIFFSAHILSPTAVRYSTTRWQADTVVEQPRLSRCDSNPKASLALPTHFFFFPVQRSSFANGGQSDVTFTLRNHNHAPAQQAAELIIIRVWMIQRPSQSSPV